MTMPPIPSNGRVCLNPCGSRWHYIESICPLDRWDGPLIPGLATTTGLPTNDDDDGHDFVDRLDISPAAQRVIDALVESNMRPMLVGGMVRDTILGRPSKDVDIEVHSTDDQPLALDDLLDVVDRLPGYRASITGQSFAVVLATHQDSGESFDISLPRTDSKVGEGHRGFEVSADSTMGPEEAARRRDLTINTIMVDMTDGSVVDPFDGMADIESGTLRAVDESTFADDPLRVLRVGRFASQLGFNVADDTMALSQRHAHQVTSMSGERVWGEFSKAMRSPNPSYMLEFMHTSGVMSRLTSPEVSEAMGSPSTRALVDRAAQQAQAERLSDRDTNTAVIAIALTSLNSDQRQLMVTNLAVAQHTARNAIRLAEHLGSIIRHPTVSTLRAAQRAQQKSASTDAPATTTVSALRAFHSGRAQDILGALERSGRPVVPEPPLLNGQDAMSAGLSGRDIGVTLARALAAQDDGVFNDHDGALSWLHHQTVGEAR